MGVVYLAPELRESMHPPWNVVYTIITWFWGFSHKNNVNDKAIAINAAVTVVCLNFPSPNFLPGLKSSVHKTWSFLAKYDYGEKKLPIQAYTLPKNAILGGYDGIGDIEYMPDLPHFFAWLDK